MATYHRVEQIQLESSGMLLLRVDDRSLHIDLRMLSPRMARASVAELSIFELSPSGYGLHWPLLDEDISIDGLLGVMHHPVPLQKSA